MTLTPVTRRVAIGILSAAATSILGLAGYALSQDLSQAQKVPVLEERISNYQDAIGGRLDSIDKNVQLLLQLHLVNLGPERQAGQAAQAAQAGQVQQAPPASANKKKD